MCFIFSSHEMNWHTQKLSRLHLLLHKTILSFNNWIFQKYLVFFSLLKGKQEGTRDNFKKNPFRAFEDQNASLFWTEFCDSSHIVLYTSTMKARDEKRAFARPTKKCRADAQWNKKCKNGPVLIWALQLLFGVVHKLCRFCRGEGSPKDDLLNRS